MTKHRITFAADVRADVFGVLDGRAITAEIMPHLLQAVAPYVGGCADCAVDLIHSIAQRVVATAEEKDALIIPVMYHAAPAPEGTEASFFDHHLRMTWPKTAELMGHNRCQHVHDFHFGWPRKPLSCS